MRIRHLAGAIGAALLFSAGAHADGFQQVVSFGDSLSDSGNVAILSGSPVPVRFTTNPGTTAVENIATYFNLSLTPSLSGGTDYAFGGARAAIANPVPATSTQIQQYLTANGGKANPNALYTMWIGANDLLAATANPATAQVVVATAATQEVGQIKALQAAGAKTIVVFNLPDVGKTPAALSQGAAASAGITQLTQVYNGILSGGLASAQRGIVPIDTYALLNEVIASPGTYGFTNVTVPACTTASSITCTPATLRDPNAASTYLFADGIHPTTAAHALLGQYAISVITAPQKISLLGEAGLATSDAHTRVLRNQMMADNFGADTRVFASADYGQQRFKSTDTSPKADSDNVNLTVGADAKVNENISVGVAMGVASTNADFSGGGGYKMTDIMGSGYAFYHAGGGYIGGFASFGQLSFTDIDRRIDLGTARRTETGKTDGSHVGGGLQGGWWFGSETLKTGPFASLTFEQLRVFGYNEYGGDSTAMNFGKQVRNARIETAGWRVQGSWQSGNTVLHPFAEVAYNHDGRADARYVTAGLMSMSGRFEVQGFTPDKTWATADLGLTADFSQTWSGWAAYSGRFGDDTQRNNSLNLGVKMAF
ncbi:outer membrane lipase/esterase [Luteibacter sp. OK325]|jgi:outer membrane lipase/esterase|uniref:autotransporter outer membrane beta-barrel domain-containing protein n=1 Tax=Luteibacter sp. OK325 TaxID=2135670 RepID=UPI000D371FBA|nr:autotransporter domain-containing protein [Luteibacter sp. OK325]PTR27234.1 outer membrane lipase/esterase [Luteibacter sp. OK325]